ncbi:MAG TPA: SH3 domain-containing protein [Chryseolinea sp.]
MKNMQRQVLKILLIIPGLCGFLAASGQVSSFRLSQADSLFEKKQYTQSLEHYQAMLQTGEYTPSMLLKMAYIEEGLGRVGQALYYLDLYYLAANDKSVLDKMDELATKYNLKGYEYTDATLALSFYHDYREFISVGLAALAVFFLSLLFYWRKRRKRSIAAVTVLFVIVVALVVHINVGEKIATGIIGEPNTYLMDGPSAGASVISVVSEGHRVEITGKYDVWYRVKWNEEVAFVRDIDLLTIREL